MLLVAVSGTEGVKSTPVSIVRFVIGAAEPPSATPTLTADPGDVCNITVGAVRAVLTVTPVLPSRVRVLEACKTLLAMIIAPAVSTVTFCAMRPVLIVISVPALIRIELDAINAEVHTMPLVVAIKLMFATFSAPTVMPVPLVAAEVMLTVEAADPRVPETAIRPFPVVVKSTVIALTFPETDIPVGGIAPVAADWMLTTVAPVKLPPTTMVLLALVIRSIVSAAAVPVTFIPVSPLPVAADCMSTRVVPFKLPLTTMVLLPLVVKLIVSAVAEPETLMPMAPPVAADCRFIKAVPVPVSVPPTVMLLAAVVVKSIVFAVMVWARGTLMPVPEVA